MTSKYTHINTHILDNLLDLSEPGETSLIAELLEIFEATTPDLLNSLQSSIEKNERQTIHAVAHRLKGSASNIGARLMADACLEIEKRAKGESGAIDLELFHSVSSLYKQSCSEIKAWLQESLKNKSY